MARKDTRNALIKRGIEEEVVDKLLTKFSTIKSISESDSEELVALGLTAEQAVDAQAKTGTVRASRAKSAPKSDAVDEIEVPQMEIVDNKHHEFSEMENKLLDIAKGFTPPLPLKVIVDIAARIEGTKFAEDGETQKRLIEKAHEMYTNRTMAAHESVGVMAAHSIGEPGTQMNMRTFHNAGVGNVLTTSGLPRLIEIVDARRIPSTPSMTIPLIGLAAEDQNVARHVSCEIETTLLINVAEIETDVNNMKLIIKPEQRKMDDRGITVDDIVEKLGKVKILRGLVEKNDDDEVIVTSDEPSFKKLQLISDAVKGAKIKGIEGISRAILTKEDNAWKIVTAGSNLKEVLKIEGVNTEKVKTNSVLEIADVFGIEAARNSIINEIYSTLSEAGLTVDIRHIMLVADLMTNDGKVNSIGRHGISGRKTSVLARAAFEITTPHLLHAAMNGEVDNLEGVAENIIVGQPVTLGTGAVNLIYTPKKKKGDKE